LQVFTVEQWRLPRKKAQIISDTKELSSPRRLALKVW
jgi:hypothetical protein